MRHTQGKWEVTGQSENSRYITVKSDNGRTVARVPWNSEKEVEQGICTDNDDAILISAAPELLSACKYALGVLESIPEVYAEQIADILDESIDINRLESVIAKAEGRL